jgi:hypothetical protein
MGFVGNRDQENWLNGTIFIVGYSKEFKVSWINAVPHFIRALPFTAGR